jgi:hypothetical protein
LIIRVSRDPAESTSTSRLGLELAELAAPAELGDWVMDAICSTGPT